MLMVRVLFVCLGNICRSPIAQGVFEQLLEERGLSDQVSADSAGTAAYHIGELPDERTRANARSHGIELTHRARQVSAADLQAFDYVITMDKSNYDNVLKLYQTAGGKAKALLQMMRSFDVSPDDVDVPDPYYGGAEGFEHVYQIVRRSAERLIDYLVERHHLSPKQV